MPLTLQDFVNENGNVSIEDISDSDQKRINDALSDLTTDPGGPGKGGPTAISDWNDLEAIRDNPNGDFVLIDDLDKDTQGYSDVVGSSEGGFDPLPVFSGNFNGRGYTISDLEINKPDLTAAGLFQIVEGGKVENIDLTQVDINAFDAVGGIAGGVQGNATVSNVTVEGSKIESQTTEGSRADYGTGGIGGIVLNSDIKDSKTDINVKSAQYAGGIAGKLVEESTNIIRCGVVGDVTGKALDEQKRINGLAIGGAIGFVANNPTIEDCYATGSVTGSEKAGGLVAQIQGSAGTIKTSFAGGNLTLTGLGEGGALVGAGEDPTIENAYFDDEGAEGSSGFGTPLSTEEIQGDSAEDNLTGFDFEEVWETVEADYPKLQ